MSASKPTLLLVPGSFALHEVYTSFEDHIRFYGYDIVYADLPSIGRRSGLPPATVSDDAAHIRALILQQFEANRSVVLVAHSYGGIPATECLKGLTAKERPGGPAILRIVYVTAITIRKGTSLESMRDEGQPEDLHKVQTERNNDKPEGVELTVCLPLRGLSLSYLQTKQSDGYLNITDLVASGARDFSMLPPVEQVEWAKCIDVHSAASFSSPLTHEGYLDLPVTYLLANRDQSLRPEIQMTFIQTMKDAGADVTVVPFESDHCWSASVPKSTAVLILRAIDPNACS